jgi:hypothetical protein
MRKTITLLLTIVLTLCAAWAYAIGYTVFTRDMVTPQWEQIIGLGGMVIMVQNPGATPAYPATFRTVVCRPATFSVYSNYSANRAEVWEDYAGAATAEDIAAACSPIWNPLNPSTGE